MKTCPNCGGVLHKKTTACFFCGKSNKRDEKIMKAFQDFKSELSQEFKDQNWQSLGAIEMDLIRECVKKL